MRCGAALGECLGIIERLKLTLTIHSRVADTLGRVYLEQIEQIREQQDQIQLHGARRTYTH